MSEPSFTLLMVKWPSRSVTAPALSTFYLHTGANKRFAACIHNSSCDSVLGVGSQRAGRQHAKNHQPLNRLPASRFCFHFLVIHVLVINRFYEWLYWLKYPIESCRNSNCHI